MGRPIGTYFCVTKNRGIPCVSVYRADDIIARSIMARDTRAFRTVTKYTRTQSVLFLLYLCSSSLTRCPWPRCSTSRFTDNEITSTAQKTLSSFAGGRLGRGALQPWNRSRVAAFLRSWSLEQRGCWHFSNVIKSNIYRLFTLSLLFPVWMLY